MYTTHIHIPTFNRGLFWSHSDSQQQFQILTKLTGVTQVPVFYW